MGKSGIYFDSSRFDEVVPCQLRCSEGLSLEEGEWLCARLLCRLRPTLATRLTGRTSDYGLVFIGQTPPPAGLVSFISPFLADGVCVTLRYGEKNVPKRIAYCDLLGDMTMLLED